MPVFVKLMLNMKYFWLFAFAVALWLPTSLQAAGADLSIVPSSIRFSKEVLIVGDEVRIYATVKNVSPEDVTAQVFFYQGAYLIGKSQPISVVAGGGRDDVFVDFTLPEGSFNIQAEIRGATPTDTNQSNDVAITPLYKALKDTDGDSVLDENDNCPEAANQNQEDIDGDENGDACDDDKDGDGVANGQDEYPTDSTKSDKPVVEKKPVVPTPPAATQQHTTEPTTATAQPQATETTKPSVLGVREDEESPESSQLIPDVKTDDGRTESEAVALNLNDFGRGGTMQSPDARFTYTQVDWRTYTFEATPPLGGSGYIYAWDFGDGATSAQQSITHAFPRSGVYTVQLAIIDEDGKVSSDAQMLDVSFFHLQNPLLQITIAVLLLIIAGLIVLIFKLRHGKVDELEV